MARKTFTPDEAAESIHAIRAVLDRTTRYTQIAWSGIAVAGLAAVAAAVAGLAVPVSPRTRPYEFLGLWAAALLVAIVCVFLTTAKKARLAREPVWSRKLQVVTLGFLPSMILGGVVTALLLDVGSLELAPGLWMGLYGVGILSVAHVLDGEFQVTAWAFLLASAVTLFLLRSSPHLGMLIAFGGIHLALGGFRFFKEGRCRPA